MKQIQQETNRYEFLKTKALKGHALTLEELRELQALELDLIPFNEDEPYSTVDLCIAWRLYDLLSESKI